MAARLRPPRRNPCALDVCDLLNLINVAGDSIFAFDVIGQGGVVAFPPPTPRLSAYENVFQLVEDSSKGIASQWPQPPEMIRDYDIRRQESKAGEMMRSLESTKRGDM